MDCSQVVNVTAGSRNKSHAALTLLEGCLPTLLVRPRFHPRPPFSSLLSSLTASCCRQLHLLQLHLLQSHLLQLLCRTCLCFNRQITLGVQKAAGSLEQPVSHLTQGMYYVKARENDDLTTRSSVTRGPSPRELVYSNSQSTSLSRPLKVLVSVANIRCRRPSSKPNLKPNSSHCP